MATEFPFTLPQVEKDILKYQRLLAWAPRSDPDRPALLMQLAVQRTMRNKLSPQKGNLDKCITHVTEAVLLPFQSSRDVVYMFFQLASALFSRFNVYDQSEDVKSSIKYFRFLRINFHPLDAFNIPHGQITSRLVRALAENLMSGSGNMIQDMEEMAALTRELLCSGVLTSDVITATEVFSAAVTCALLEDVKLPLEKVIQVLQEAEVIIPDSDVSCALAHCLTHRFQTAHVIDDYDSAIAIVDKIVAAQPPKGSLTTTQIKAIQLIQALVVARMNLYTSPEYLEDAIHRFRTLLSLPSLPDQERTGLATFLDVYAKQRSRYFGIAENSGEGETPFRTFLIFYRRAPSQWSVDPANDPESRMLENAVHLEEILTTIQNDEKTGIEAAVERSRTLLPIHHSSDQVSCLLTSLSAEIFFRAHLRTNRLDYLNEAITAFHGLRKVSSAKAIHFREGEMLLRSVFARWNLLGLQQDFEEGMQLFSEVANDISVEVFDRFEISNWWAHNARVHAHPSISTAYETAMSLMQETLVFSPTLQTQHLRLFRAFREAGGLPSDFASYQIEKGQLKQAIETLERGRALLWSEMRGLRTSTDQLRIADPALAEKLADINRRLESVTMSVAQSERGDIDTGARRGPGEGMDSIGRLVTTQRRLLEERYTLISHIQSLPGFENFLKPPSFDVLDSAAAHGPVIIINQSQFPSYILLLLKDSPPSVISTPSNFHNRANQLKDELLRVRKEKGLDSKDYGDTLASVLADLYELVGRPVIERLHQFKVPEKSRIWFCPMEAFCSLPLHAMGPIPSDDQGGKVYFMDLYIPSYTPTLSALIESRKPDSQPETLDRPSLLLVAQPETLPGAWGEIDVLQAVGSPVTTLVSNEATPTTVVASLRDHRFVHFVCHGSLETGKPFDASFELHGNNLTLLEIVRSQLPAAEFAFLSACHTAELTEESIADEGLHLAAAMQFCGFRSVVGTMWAMADTDGADLSKNFYKPIFSESTGRRRVPYYEKSARALQSAVKKLRKKRGVTLERWVNFVHYGA